MLRSGNATHGYTQSTRNSGYRYVPATCMIQMDPLCTSVPAPAVITLAPKTGQGPGDLTPHHRLANAAESNRTPPVHLTTRCLLSDRHRTFAAVIALRSVSSIDSKGLAPNSVKASHSFTHSRPQRCARVYVRDGGREKRRQIPSIECGTFKVRLSRKYPTRGERDTETDGEWERKRKCEWTMPKTCMRRRLSLRTRALFLCLCLSLSRALALSLFLWSPSSPVPV
ncbi:hypothetical protein CABS03_00653 [Colletotrichum abscissum]|uniref:Uncharacterized protein n=2 Tax=Colletotrichum abscissum TaxID=1671311 RepID=A0A9P9X2X4_9PEZI|nr:hypothetical protein CABS02_13426 [Colletotrichum abscissum]